jgi:AraC-like DNA-binding protein
VTNVSAILIVAHAGYLVFRGRRDDLMEQRQRLRAPVLGLFAVFGVWEVAIFMLRPIAPGAFMLFVSQPYGVALVGLLLVGAAPLFLEARADLFGRPMPRLAGEPGAATALQAQARADAADQILLEKLRLAMEAGVWRREGLTIGSLAEELGVPEHRLRRLINSRMGHRNFSEFLNGRRIEQAKARLADRATAHLTVAEIAFDLGYGSLGPFNRAFRAATGVTPTAWRAEALKTSPNS